MGNGVDRVKDWMGVSAAPPPPGSQCVRRQLRMDEIDIRDYLVYWVKSNLYRDSEGTLGHEFYEEEILVDEQTGTVRRGMKRITENLTPEVMEALPHPALSHKLPVVFYKPE
eukprot:TRINITY_DN822_c0_g1_i2.p1 TRINITY_DN822_c0_g1~~TRINITY_DN822_c0_g1_i2.p1  ORF type:complete len:112 (-),score=25.57 TRINITY_DN822_c0_g1_i2:263-598(-)